ncbi:HisA/HisF-related TIM barrel protein [Noviluteimonas gilva]|jgi:phosphoribosylformimino-5-aminoimidazole carboxamide ribotide isomerase|uniref:1-(5-phosphoribosyl)-5-[(5-phosphoribosylamino)methylideneamino] imidazole-4-carboxamide isomerase n=1 Tax=Noviluteimonas gilva TaxID=2682097 RepID=A0A7C9LM07_9GAMM|nr:1-(5-phosphoribosyl)-5-[(5-phosphoribosylamino)methylideneamino] imidazole-4-carboxamide isomerase [Lysobacter gilvus]MUV14704.1 1-(5-phosphoribosyl)-5-((5-phosphoribosylamino)methylideneamino)imidazole-4-carboxamide isomerase [Lysobacter gilvus]
MSFTCYPAIDVRDGCVVRLRQGDYAQETRYDPDPHACAMRFADAGATWLHLVDLDAARAGGYTLAPLLRRIADEGRLQVQTGGGVRTREDIASLLDAGATRVVIGSLAAENPALVAQWIEDFGAERIVVALDVRVDQGRWLPAIRGWTRNASADALGLLVFHRDHGLRHLLCTDVARDGMLSGIDPALYTALRRCAPEVAIQVSGGVRDVADVRAARTTGCAGAILGRALLDGHLSLSEALAC